MKNLYLFAIIHLMMATVLCLVILSICLYFDFVSLIAILGSFGAGFVLAIPLSAYVAKKISAGMVMSDNSES